MTQSLHIQNALHLDHTLFLPSQSSPHAFQFLLTSLNRHFVQRIIIIRRQFDFTFINTVTGLPVVNSSVRAQQTQVKPVGLSNTGQRQVLKLNLKDECQGCHTEEGAKDEEKGLTGTSLDETTKGNGFSGIHDFVVVGLHVSHDFSRLLTKILLVVRRGCLTGTHVCFSLNLGRCRSFDLRPNTRKGHDIQSQHSVVTITTVRDFTDCGRNVNIRNRKRGGGRRNEIAHRLGIHQMKRRRRFLWGSER
mmetsp:Transcript_8100/g.13413  ORF Transcript_8100/g.13413 Transcript_8100/m.13413 type:complete len:248 (+) Transcript_8100:140-883(+)